MWLAYVTSPWPHHFLHQTSARSSSVVSATMSWSPWYISSISCLSKLSNVLDTYLLPCYYLLQNLLQLTNSNLSFSLSLFHHITFITKPFHNYIMGLKSPTIMAFVATHFPSRFCFCVFLFLCFLLLFSIIFLFILPI